MREDWLGGRCQIVLPSGPLSNVTIEAIFYEIVASCLADLRRYRRPVSFCSVRAGLASPRGFAGILPERRCSTFFIPIPTWTCWLLPRGSSRGSLPVTPGYRGWVVIDEIQKVPHLLDEVHRGAASLLRLAEVRRRSHRNRSFRRRAPRSSIMAMTSSGILRLFSQSGGFLDLDLHCPGAAGHDLLRSSIELRK